MNLGGGWNWEAGHGRHKEKLKNVSDGQDILFFFFLERAEEAGGRMDMSLRDTVLPVTSLPAPSLQPG